MKPRIFCPYCNSELRWGDKFCGKCGKQVELSESPAAPEETTEHQGQRAVTEEMACETCGTINKPGTEFCKRCGSDLRRQQAGSATPTVGSFKQGKKSHQAGRKDLKPLPILNSWKPVVAVVVIVLAAVLIDRYTSRENIPQAGLQQQSVPSQQPTGANMAALPQIEDMERQVKAEPGNMGLTLQLANFLSDNRFYDKAITYYQAYLKKKPDDTNARVDMGICYKEVGQFESAVREMKKALEYDPRHLFATFNLGIVCLDEGKNFMDEGQMDKANELIKESNDWFKKTVALAPTSEVGKRAQQLLSQHSGTQLSSSN
jgi:tetratricopeptide (TPR) repeat protein/DNA-directed RNA polymerase subunit RPC12/RpoP